MKKWVLASNNKGKLSEISHLLAPVSVQLLTQAECGISETDEPFFTFVENALRKARHASRLSGLPALADDSGLCVQALNGAPGVLSARFGGEPQSDARNNQALLNALQHTENRRAYYYCVLVWVRHADDPQPIIADGTWQGDILYQAQGTGGFGYDPLFWLQDSQCSAAELSPVLKNARSHRGQALHSLMQKLAMQGVLN